MYHDVVHRELVMIHAGKFGLIQRTVVIDVDLDLSKQQFRIVAPVHCRLFAGSSKEYIDLREFFDRDWASIVVNH